MKQVVILSGKGGTGKTTVTSMVAYEISRDTDIQSPVFCDADVDAANLELILAPEQITHEYFFGGKTAVFSPTNCIGCQRCVHLCRFDAISVGPGSPKDIQIDHISCEGCGLCALACPRGSITLQRMTDGEWAHSLSRFGHLFHANLYPGQENSGKLVTQVRNQAIDYAKEHASDILLIDGPPGIGCPVISSVTGVDLALIVTEPTVSGVHDLARILETVDHFDTPALVIINKATMNESITMEIKEYCQELGIPIIGEIPFDQALTNAIVNAKTIQEFAPSHSLTETFHHLWLEIKSKISETVT